MLVASRWSACTPPFSGSPSTVNRCFLFTVVGFDRPCCYGYILTAAKARRGGGRVVLAAEVAASLVVASAVVGADGAFSSFDGDLVVGVGDGLVTVGAGGCHVWMIWGGW